MRTAAQKSPNSRPGSGVANTMNSNPGPKITTGKTGFVRGVRGWRRFHNRNEEFTNNPNTKNHNTYFLGFNPGLPGLKAKNKVFFSSPGLKNPEMQPRTPDSGGRGGWRQCIRVVVVDAVAEVGSMNCFCLADRRFRKRDIDDSSWGHKVIEPHEAERVMSMKKSRGGRPPLSKNERTVPTMIRLLPSDRKVIEAFAKRQDMTIGTYLREVAQEHVAKRLQAA